MKRTTLFYRIIILVLIFLVSNVIWGVVPRKLAEIIPSLPCYYTPSDININSMIESPSFFCSIETNNVSDTIVIMVQSIYDLNKKSDYFNCTIVEFKKNERNHSMFFSGRDYDNYNFTPNKQRLYTIFKEQEHNINSWISKIDLVAAEQKGCISYSPELKCYAIFFNYILLPSSDVLDSVKPSLDYGITNDVFCPDYNGSENIDCE